MDNSIFLKTKFKNETQSFELLKEGVKVYMNTIKHNFEYVIPYDEIKPKVYILIEKPNPLYTILIISILLNYYLILTILNSNYNFSTIVNFTLFMSPLFVSGSLMQNLKKYKEKHIEASKVLYFFYNSSNQEDVDTFIEKIFKKREEYFKNLYYKIDENTPYNLQFERYLWLYENSIITKSEFEVIKDDLDAFIGFGKNLNI